MVDAVVSRVEPMRARPAIGAIHREAGKLRRSTCGAKRKQMKKGPAEARVGQPADRPTLTTGQRWLPQ